MVEDGAEGIHQLGLLARLDGEQHHVHFLRVHQVDARCKLCLRDALWRAHNVLDKGLERLLQQLVDLVVHVLVVDHAFGPEDIVPDGPPELRLFGAAC